MANGFSIEKLCDDNLLLRTELIVCTCAIGMLTTTRAALLIGTPSDELREIAVLLDSVLQKAQERIQVVPGLIEQVNQAGLQAIELLKAPVASGPQ